MKKQVVNNAEAPQRRLALHSALDYILFAVKQKWCLSNTLLPDLNCNLNHAANIERLLISPEQEIFLRDLQTKGLLPQPLPVGGVRLQQIEARVDVQAMSQAHPLFKVLQAMQVKSSETKIKYVFVRLRKENATSLPQSGRETFIEVYVSFQDESGQAIQFGGAKVEGKTLISAHPRELGSFALIVSGNLKMNSGAIPEAGDVVFPEFTNADGLNGSPGLIFESPVFVNRASSAI